MDFIFTCPSMKKTFETAEFRVDRKGSVVTDSSGNKTFDARVELIKPCPFCGEKHVFQASELACPFK